MLAYYANMLAKADAKAKLMLKLALAMILRHGKYLMWHNWQQSYQLPRWN